MYYYAYTDENDILCVDKVAEKSQSEMDVSSLASYYPTVIYFKAEK